MKKPKKAFKAEVNAVLCKECGYCREVCPQEVFEQSSSLNSSGYHYMVAEHAENCNGCLKCFHICPDFAVAVEPVEEDRTTGDKEKPEEKRKDPGGRAIA
jgi:NAD-dependent dihydropyrimidine dehydrogenase PreA subunit